MKYWWVVALGGAVGSVARYATMILVAHLAGPIFPWGTLAVNALGSLLLGITIELLAICCTVPEPYRIFLVVGVLGGFTTFSTFSLDVVTLMSRDIWWQSMAYIIASLALGVFGLMLGLRLTRWVWGMV